MTGRTADNPEFLLKLVRKLNFGLSDGRIIKGEQIQAHELRPTVSLAVQSMFLSCERLAKWHSGNNQCSKYFIILDNIRVFPMNKLLFASNLAQVVEDIHNKFDSRTHPAVVLVPGISLWYSDCSGRWKNWVWCYFPVRIMAKPTLFAATHLSLELQRKSGVHAPLLRRFLVSGRTFNRKHKRHEKIVLNTIPLLQFLSVPSELEFHLPKHWFHGATSKLTPHLQKLTHRWRELIPCCQCFPLPNYAEIIITEWLPNSAPGSPPVLSSSHLNVSKHFFDDTPQI